MQPFIRILRQPSEQTQCRMHVTIHKARQDNIPFHIDHTMGLILGTDYITFSNCYNAISLDSNRTVFNDSLPHSLSCHCDHNAVVKQNVQHSLSLQVTRLLGHPLVLKKRRCLHPIFIVYTKNDKSQL